MRIFTLCRLIFYCYNVCEDRHRVRETSLWVSRPDVHTHTLDHAFPIGVTHTQKKMTQCKRESVGAPVKRESAQKKTDDDEAEEEPTCTVMLNRTNALLTLYTDVDHYGLLHSTRSVILTRPGPNRLVLLDNLHWTLYISVPQCIPPRMLKKFMINSYCAMHYIHPYENKEQDGGGDYQNRVRGLYASTQNNHMISDDIKQQLLALDTRHTECHRDYMTRMSQETRLFAMQQEEEEEEEDDDDDDDRNSLWPREQKRRKDWYYLSELVKNREYEKTTDNSRLACRFDADVDLMRGLYDAKETVVERGDDDDDDTGQQQHQWQIDVQATPPLHINREMQSLYGETAVAKRFPAQDQYRLTFNNHTVLHYFVNRFQRRSVTIRILGGGGGGGSGTDATANPAQMEEKTFSVNVLDFEADPLNVRSLRPMNKLYSGQARDYVERQMYRFKGTDPGESVAFTFPLRRRSGSGEEEALGECMIPTVPRGLLHPSALETHAGVGNSYQSAQNMNVYANMDRTRAPCATNAAHLLAYQTLYIDLSQAVVAPTDWNGAEAEGQQRAAFDSMLLLDWSQRHMSLAATQTVAEFAVVNEQIDPVNARARLLAEQQQDGGGGVTPPKSTTTTVVARVITEKPIKNQPRLGDFVVKHNVKLMDPEERQQRESEYTKERQQQKRKVSPVPVSEETVCVRTKKPKIAIQRPSQQQQKNTSLTRFFVASRPATI